MNELLLPKVKKKTLSIFLNNDHELNSILKSMASISKNVYNTTIYIYSIFYKHKEDIFLKMNDLITNKIIKNIDDLHKYIQVELQYFYNLHSKNNLIKTNNDILYKKIKEKLTNTLLTNNNFDKIRTEIIIENNSLKSTSKYEYESIIDNILKSFYLKTYNRTRYQINNKIEISIKDEVFIDQIKKEENLFPKSKSTKEIVESNDIFKDTTVHCDQNIITRFIYLHLDENKNKLPSDLINNIIPKAFSNMSSFYALKDKGIKANMCKYLKKDKLFILPFFERSFLLTKGSNVVRLTVGKYVAKNYTQITNNKNYVCLNDDAKTAYKYYCLKDYLMEKLKGDKIAKLKYYTVKIENKEYYISKNNKNIINSYYLNIQIPTNKINGKIKLIEINPLYKGRYFKLNIVYDVGTYDDNFKVLPKKSKKIKKSKKEKEKDKTEKVKKIVPPKPIYDDFDSISVDFGMKNLMTIYDPTGSPIIIKGNYLISLNCYYNSLIDIYKSLKDSKNKDNPHITKEKYIKRNNKLKEKIIKQIDKKCQNENIDKLEHINKVYYGLLIKRQNKINDYFNKLVKYLYIMYKHKKHIILGYNINWKTGVKMGKKNNRKFYNIPYSKLIYKLQDKFEERIIITEESYTSKCDALLLEKIGKHDTYSGNRKHRGLFISGNGIKINGDLNGAINIMRKKIKIEELKGYKIFNPKILSNHKIISRCHQQLPICLTYESIMGIQQLDHRGKEGSQVLKTHVKMGPSEVV